MRVNFTTAIQAFAAMALAFVVFVPASLAEGDGRGSAIEARHAGGSDAARVVTVVARVALRDGSPAHGAVVVTSAGGQGVTDENGVAHLEATLSQDAEALHVTAATTVSGTTSTGSVRAHAAGEARHIDAGTITLAGTGACVPEWIPTFGGQPGVNGVVQALAVFDDGAGGGPALYVGGNFTSAGGVAANRIARWDGASWSPVGSGISGGSIATVLALAVFDDGSGGGPALYAAGFFTSAGGVPVSNIAKWDGAAWSPVGSGVDSTVLALTVYDEGAGGGPALFAGGIFTVAGGAPASRIARWDGVAWSPLGSGMNGDVSALTVFDDASGDGPALYAGGEFTSAGGVSASRIAKWDGAAWSPVGTGVNNEVFALTVFDDGAGGGDALYAGGIFTAAGGAAASRIARWDGASWSPLGSGVSGVDSDVLALTVFDDGLGGGPALYVGGRFEVAGGAPISIIARWDGAAWSALGFGTNDDVRALTVYDDGAGPALFAGGQLSTAGLESASRIAKWDGAVWSPVGFGLNERVFALTIFDDGSGGGPALYAGGLFSYAGGAPVNRVAKWDGAAWSPLGIGLNNRVFALTVFDDGSGGGPALYAAGTFTTAGGAPANRIAKWDGAAWSPLGSGMGNTIYALTVFDDGAGGGPALYAAGFFASADGVLANNIAKWDGSAWSALGSGLNSTVFALTASDDGPGGGPALYAGGGFTTAGGMPAERIAKWDGAAWSPLGTGVSGGFPTVRSLTVFDDGAGGGPALYVGGGFTTAGGAPASRIARWDGAAWSPLGSGISGGSTPLVHALTVFDDGSGDGPALYAGGEFTLAAGAPASYIAKWDGASWSPLGDGLGGNFPSVLAFATHDGGAEGGAALYAGGRFNASPGGDAFVARWQGCASSAPCPGDTNGDGLVNFADLNTVLGAFGQTGSGLPADLNGDGTVNFADLNEVLSNFGNACR